MFHGFLSRAQQLPAQRLDAAVARTWISG